MAARISPRTTRTTPRAEKSAFLNPDDHSDALEERERLAEEREHLADLTWLDWQDRDDRPPQ